MPKQPIDRGTNMRAIFLVAGLALAASALASPEVPPAFSDALDGAVASVVLHQVGDQRAPRID